QNCVTFSEPLMTKADFLQTTQNRGCSASVTDAFLAVGNNLLISASGLLV
ncbi:MAG: hypothetical protein ACI8VW_002491, partial [bacterium]